MTENIASKIDPMEFEKTQIPSQQELLDSLAAIGLYGPEGLGSTADRFFKHFTEVISDSPKTGRGLLNAWLGTQIGFLGQATPTIRAIYLLDDSFDLVVDTLVSDSKVADYAKKLQVQVQEQKRKYS